MLEVLNYFFTATYFHNPLFFGIQSLAVMSLAGILLGLTHQLIAGGRKNPCGKTQ